MTIYEPKITFTQSLKTRKQTTCVVLHHSATSSGTVESFHRHHQQTNGWAGIGYHYVVYKNGEIWRGRPEDKQGAHAPAVNAVSIGVCFVGDYHSEPIMPTAQLNAGRQLIHFLKSKHKGIALTTHKDVTDTTCPGKYFPLPHLLGILGDMDGDGKVTAVDALNILKASVNLVDVDSAMADMDGDGKVTAGDALNALKTAVGATNRKPNPFIEPTANLSTGDTGDGVRWIQWALNNYGYDCGAVDGVFGGKTWAAVKALQKTKGLTVDGIVGKNTRDVLKH